VYRQCLLGGPVEVKPTSSGSRAVLPATPAPPSRSSSVGLVVAIVG
jgi:hypothetical protein